MKFPGSKLLHRFDLEARETSLEDLFRSSRSSGFTGMVEVSLPGAIGLIFYYLGAEVNAMYREGSMAWSGQAALKHLATKVFDKGGSVSVFELPLDLAHLLRGIAKRQRLRDEVTDKSGLVDVLRRLEKAEHTGTIEVHTASGAAMVLLVRGRVSNHYFEANDGLTFEKGEARTRLEEAVSTGDGSVQIFVGDFSREAWKARHEVLAPVRSRLERPSLPEPSTAEVAREEGELRRQAVDGLQASLPGVLQAMIFDLLTGVVLARAGRGVADVNVSPLADQVPRLVLYMRAQLEATETNDELEFLEISTGGVTTLVAVVGAAQEAMALLADRAQPTAPLGSALLRAARDYAARLAPMRRRGTLPPGARTESAIRRA